jgi:sortase A
VSVVGVLGELLITAGVIVLLFLGWQVWLNDLILGSEQEKDAAALSQQWQQSTATPAPSTTPTVTPSAAPTAEPTTIEPVVATAPGNAQKFGVLMIPRFGSDFERPIAEGVGISDVLNTIGIGHYPGTQMPGEVGNFVLASHRMAGGGAFKDLHKLQIGDHIYVETADGWYSYTFRSLEYVLATSVDVLDPVPQDPGAEPTDRIITLTTCNPFFSTAERMIAYGVFDQWYPRADGPPAEIADTVAAEGN